MIAAMSAASGVWPGRHRVLEVAYVSAPQAALRDQVAAIFNRVGNVKNGERVEVLEREKRFARVRTGTGIEGWIEQRFLVDQKTFDALQKLTADNPNDPVQAPGVLRNDTNLHVSPGRETEHLYQLASGAKVAILKRETAEKQPGTAPPPKAGEARQRRPRRGRRSRTGGWCATLRAGWDGCWRAWSMWMSRWKLRNTPKASVSSLSLC